MTRTSTKNSATASGTCSTRTPFSHYILRVEYRFVGDQCPGGPGWAVRNSGVMLHGESPSDDGQGPGFSRTRSKCSFSAAAASGKRTTANLCTPGTNVVMDGKLVKRHCTNSTAQDLSRRPVGDGRRSRSTAAR